MEIDAFDHKNADTYFVPTTGDLFLAWWKNALLLRPAGCCPLRLLLSHGTSAGYALLYDGSQLLDDPTAHGRVDVHILMQYYQTTPSRLHVASICGQPESDDRYQRLMRKLWDTYQTGPGAPPEPPPHLSASGKVKWRVCQEAIAAKNVGMDYADFLSQHCDDPTYPNTPRTLYNWRRDLKLL